MTATYAPGIDARRPPVDQARVPRGAYRLQPLRAWKALRRLLADKEDTAAVFELMRALSGRAVPNGYQRMLRSAEGGRLAYEADEFAERLSDKAWLESFGPGTVGAAYRAFIAPRGLSAEGLADESRKTEDSQIDAAHPYLWYARRVRDIHDVWHVLTGYGTDGLGEACLVAFSYQQTKSLGFAVIANAARSRNRKLKTPYPYAEAVREGFRNGKRAKWLPEVDYVALFAEDLESARVRLGIVRPVIYESVPEEARNPLSAAG
ncbi:MAG TPA: Coq4 family protein [Caulobacteraceae bacterium]